MAFGTIVDWFGLASSALKVVSSDSGDNKQRVCVSNLTSGNAGRYTEGVGQTSGIWRNPTVTYEVVDDTTFATALGTAYAGGLGLSGYMITSVSVETGIGKFPRVTVTATANEGANAINTFAVSVPLLARARAQNLLDAVSGGGQLQNCRLVASCSPVVVAEDMMPCASDVVHGKLVVTAGTYAPNGESAPTAGSGWTSIGEPQHTGGVEYPAWSITLQKEIS